MTISLLVLATLLYYAMLIFLNNRKKTAFEKVSIQAIGDSIDLENEASISDLFGEINKSDDSEIATLLNNEDDLEANMINQVTDLDLVESPSNLSPTDSNFEGTDEPPLVPEKKEIKTEVIPVSGEPLNTEDFDVTKPTLIKNLETFSKQESPISEVEIDALIHVICQQSSAD